MLKPQLFHDSKGSQCVNSLPLTRFIGCSFLVTGGGGGAAAERGGHGERRARNKTREASREAPQSRQSSQHAQKGQLPSQVQSGQMAGGATQGAEPLRRSRDRAQYLPRRTRLIEELIKAAKCRIGFLKKKKKYVTFIGDV